MHEQRSSTHEQPPKKAAKHHRHHKRKRSKSKPPQRRKLPIAAATASAAAAATAAPLQEQKQRKSILSTAAGAAAIRAGAPQVGIEVPKERAIDPRWLKELRRDQRLYRVEAADFRKLLAFPPSSVFGPLASLPSLRRAVRDVLEIDDLADIAFITANSMAAGGPR